MMEFGGRKLNWASLHTHYKEIQNTQITFEKQIIVTKKKPLDESSEIIKQIDYSFPFLTRGIFRWYYWPTGHGIDLLDLNAHPELPVLSISTPAKILAYDIQAQKFIDPYSCPGVGEIYISLWRPCDGYSLVSIGSKGIVLFKKGIEYNKYSPDEHYKAFSKVIPWYRTFPLPINGKTTAATFSTDGRFLAMGIYGCSNVFILDINLQTYHILSYRGSAPCTLSYSKDDAFLAIGDFSGSLILFNTNNNKQRTWSGFQTSILSLQWSFNSKFLFFNTKHSNELQILSRPEMNLKSCVLLGPLELSAIKIEPLSIHVGGAIRHVRLDLSSRFLAVSFEPEDDEEDDIINDTVVQLPEQQFNRRESTPLIDFNTPLKTPQSVKYPGRGTPRKTGNFITPLSQQIRTPSKSKEKEESAKEGRTKIAIFALEFKNGKLFTSVLYFILM